MIHSPTSLLVDVGIISNWSYESPLPQQPVSTSLSTCVFLGEGELKWNGRGRPPFRRLGSLHCTLAHTLSPHSDLQSTSTGTAVFAVVTLVPFHRRSLEFSPILPLRARAQIWSHMDKTGLRWGHTSASGVPVGS